MFTNHVVFRGMTNSKELNAEKLQESDIEKHGDLLEITHALAIARTVTASVNEGVRITFT